MGDELKNPELLLDGRGKPYYLYGGDTLVRPFVSKDRYDIFFKDAIERLVGYLKELQGKFEELSFKDFDMSKERSELCISCEDTIKKLRLAYPSRHDPIYRLHTDLYEICTDKPFDLGVFIAANSRYNELCREYDEFIKEKRTFLNNPPPLDEKKKEKRVRFSSDVCGDSDEKGEPSTKQTFSPETKEKKMSALERVRRDLMGEFKKT